MIVAACSERGAFGLADGVTLYGLRVFETVTVKTGDIKSDKKCLHIPSGKGGIERMNDIANYSVDPMANPPHLGELIRESMDDAGWNVTETAARLGCER